MSSLFADALAEAPVMTRPWVEIERFYRGLVDGGLNVGGMLRLVEQIEGSQFARSLHAWASMHELFVVQVPCTYPYDGPYLRITPLFDGTIEHREQVLILENHAECIRPGSDILHSAHVGPKFPCPGRKHIRRTHGW